MAVSRPRLPGDGLPLALRESLHTQWGHTQSCPTPAQARPLAAQSHSAAQRLVTPWLSPRREAGPGGALGLPGLPASGPMGCVSA